jgi:peptide/nickel transport system permease protein
MIARPEGRSRPAPGIRAGRRERMRQLRRSRPLVAGTALVGLWVLVAVFGDLLATKDPLATDPAGALRPPSGEHWFGTDSLGRDSFARVMVGGRTLLVLAPAVAVTATVLGTVLGLVCGYRRGAVDVALSRGFEAFLALPTVIFASVAVAALGRSPPALVVAAGVPLIPIVARTVRAAVLGERELEYVDAALARSEGAAYVMFREILPNIGAVVLAEFLARFANAVVVIATLSFIGLGVQPPTPDWGREISEHYALIGAGGEWAVLFPAAAIITLVGGLVLIIDGATEVLDRPS